MLIDKIEQPIENKALASKILAEFKLIMEKYGINFWIDEGTFLGAYREGQIIEGDKDIDVGFWADLLPPVGFTEGAFLALKNRGFRIWPNLCGDATIFEKKGIPIEVLHWQRTDKFAYRCRYRFNGLISYVLYTLCILFYSPQADNVSHISDIIKNKYSLRSNYRKVILKLVIYLSEISNRTPSFINSLLFKTSWLLYKLFFSTKNIKILPKTFYSKKTEITFYDLNFMAPSYPNSFLTYNYGSDWKKPKKGWNFTKMTSDSNSSNGLFFRKDFFIK